MTELSIAGHGDSRRSWIADAGMPIISGTLCVRGHDEAAAYASGMLVTRTRQYGRGLGDRSCMALGLELGAIVMTADREWKKVKIDGLKLDHIR